METGDSQTEDLQSPVILHCPNDARPNNRRKSHPSVQTFNKENVIIILMLSVSSVNRVTPCTGDVLAGKGTGDWCQQHVRISVYKRTVGQSYNQIKFAPPSPLILPQLPVEKP